MRGLIDVKKVANHTGSTENPPTTIDLKNVKPRVDTHWTNQPARKPLSRNDSIKKPLVTGISATIGQPKLVKAKSIETATIKEVKLVKRTKSPERTSTLKRQENPLIRRKVSAPTIITTKTERTSSLSSGSSGNEKKVLIRTKSNDLKIETVTKVVAGYIADPPIVESRFPSYSNGLIHDVSIIYLYFMFELIIKFSLFFYFSSYFSATTNSSNKLKLTKEMKIIHYLFPNM